LCCPKTVESAASGKVAASRSSRASSKPVIRFRRYLIDNVSLTLIGIDHSEWSLALKYPCWMLMQFGLQLGLAWNILIWTAYYRGLVRRNIPLRMKEALNFIWIQSSYSQIKEINNRFSGYYYSLPIYTHPVTTTEGSKSNIPCCALLARNICMIRGLQDAHRTQILRVTCETCAGNIDPLLT
jgi:hypothetical protein